MCGECCRAPVILITKPSDYRRWARQRRSDILRYASVPPVQGYGDLWIDIEGSEGSNYCPFIKKVGNYKYICTIHNTKPKVCKEFRCEWAFLINTTRRKIEDNLSMIIRAIPNIENLMDYLEDLPETTVSQGRGQRGRRRTLTNKKGNIMNPGVAD